MVRFLPAPKIATCATLLFLTSIGAVTTTDAAPNSRQTPTITDNDDRIDVNNLDMAVTNHGSISYDLLTGGGGLEFPKGTGKIINFAAGLWIGAQVNDTIRMAVGEYQQEYAPGPMSGGTYLPDMVQFHNFRIERDGTGYAEYLADAVSQGAPLDSMGNPFLLGDALIWSVFNDADPSRHTASTGGTAPLGVEVQQSVFAFRRGGSLGNVVFVKWRIANKGGNRLDNAYVSFWADPDVGDASDDLVGCDTTQSLGYAYNESNVDGVYGSTPPAVGFHVLRGASVNGVPLNMTSFVRYINGADPMDAVEAYHYMSGRHADGSPIHVCDNPLEAVTTYEVSGLDPGGPGFCPTTWLDTGGSDRRLFLSTGPFTMQPGDTQVVVLAIEVGQSTDRLASIQALRNTAQIVAALYNAGLVEPPTAVESYLVDSRVEAGTIHLGWYVPVSPGTSVTVERRTVGSTWSAVAETALPPDHVIRFDDADVAAGERYGYRLVIWSGPVQDYTAETWIQAAPPQEMPTSLRLLPARPNPSSASFQIRHYVPKRGSFRLSVLDAQGRVVRVLSRREFLPGWYESTWNGRDSSGRDAASGTYFLRIEGAGSAETRKLVLMR